MIPFKSILTVNTTSPIIRKQYDKDLGIFKDIQNIPGHVILVDN
jgi:hypothetical protein